MFSHAISSSPSIERSITRVSIGDRVSVSNCRNSPNSLGSLSAAGFVRWRYRGSVPKDAFNRRELRRALAVACRASDRREAPIAFW